MPKTKQHRKQNGQKQYHPHHVTHTHSHTSNTGNRKGGTRSQPSHSARSYHNAEWTTGFPAQAMRRGFYEEQNEGERVQQRVKAGHFSGVRDVPKHPVSAAQGSDDRRGRGGYWRTSPVHTRSGRRNAPRQPPSAAQGRSDSRERAAEAVASQAGDRRGNGRREADQDAGHSTSTASRSQQHGTHHHNTRSSGRHPQHPHNASQNGGSSGTRVRGIANPTSVQHADRAARRAPNVRSPIQTRSSSHLRGSRALAASSLTEPSVQLQPRAKAAQGKKNSRELASVSGNNSAVQPGTSKGTEMRQRPGTAQGRNPTSSRPPKSSGPYHGKQDNKRKAVPHRGTARPAERKTARKAGRGTANKGGTARSGGRKSTASASVATTQAKGKKRTANQAFGGADRQARAKATVAKKGTKKPTTVETAKKQVERPTTTGTTKKQKIAVEPDCCPICLSELTTQQLAHPDVCRHVFCLQCLQTWQQRKNTCPIDNKEFQTLQLCSQDGKDIMPVVKNKNNGVVPVGIPPYNPLPPAQNRGEIRNPRDRHDEQSGYNSPGDWGYDGGLEDSSESWDDDQMGIRIEIRDGSEREGYDDQRDSVSDWSELNMDHHDDSGERNQRDESWDDDTGTLGDYLPEVLGIEISSGSERRDNDDRGGDSDWSEATMYDVSVLGNSYQRVESWDGGQESWDDRQGSWDDRQGSWDDRQGSWEDGQGVWDDGHDSWDYEESLILEADLDRADDWDSAYPDASAYADDWGPASAYRGAHWSSEQRHLGNAQADWASRYEHWAAQQAQIWNGYNYGNGYYQQGHWWSDSSTSSSDDS
ncbi:uncharacterized protein [Branchiostoma lanceolatum]|uniref:uncharacterized protein n=1 Tax=Branchiostoma lanceolatum TaxID=7740 RepID=UPI0034564B58